MCSDGATLQYTKDTGLLSFFPSWQQSEDDSGLLALHGVPGNIALLVCHWLDKERGGSLEIRPLSDKREDRQALKDFWGTKYVPHWCVGRPNVGSPVAKPAHVSPASSGRAAKAVPEASTPATRLAMVSLTHACLAAHMPRIMRRSLITVS